MPTVGFETESILFQAVDKNNIDYDTWVVKIELYF